MTLNADLDRRRSDQRAPDSRRHAPTEGKSCLYFHALLPILKPSSSQANRLLTCYRLLNSRTSKANSLRPDNHSWFAGSPPRKSEELLFVTVLHPIWLEMRHECVIYVYVHISRNVASEARKTPPDLLSIQLELTLNCGQLILCPGNPCGYIKNILTNIFSDLFLTYHIHRKRDLHFGYHLTSYYNCTLFGFIGD